MKAATQASEGVPLTCSPDHNRAQRAHAPLRAPRQRGPSRRARLAAVGSMRACTAQAAALALLRVRHEGTEPTAARGSLASRLGRSTARSRATEPRA